MADARTTSADDSALGFVGGCATQESKHGQTQDLRKIYGSTPKGDLRLRHADPRLIQYPANERNHTEGVPEKMQEHDKTLAKGMLVLGGALVVGFVAKAQKQLDDTSRTIRFTPQQTLEYYRKIFENLKKRRHGLRDAMTMASIYIYSKAYNESILEYDRMVDERYGD